MLFGVVFQSADKVAEGFFRLLNRFREFAGFVCKRTPNIRVGEICIYKTDNVFEGVFCVEVFLCLTALFCLFCAGR